MLIFVDSAVEAVDASDRPAWIAGWGQRVGGVEVEAAVGAGGGVVLDVGRQDLFGVASVPDQGLVEAFGANGAKVRTQRSA